MDRGSVVLEWLVDGLPEWTVAVAALVTRLGDVAVLVAVAFVASWTLARGRRSRTSTDTVDRRTPFVPSDGSSPIGPWVLGLAVGGLSAVIVLKYAFALPRPSVVVAVPTVVPAPLEPWFVSSVTIGGYAFPSGHAAGATVVYGLVALSARVGTRRLRLAVASLVVLAVSLSRLVVAVHYPLDVVAGIAVGVGYLAGVGWLLEQARGDRTTVSFAIAFGLAALAAVASGFSTRALQYVALSAGALAAWSVANRRFDPGSKASSPAAFAVTGVAVVVTCFVVAGATAASPALLGVLAVALSAHSVDRGR
ncbi:phosphatase PAP2 family protein [Natrialba swarupiae]|uniref:Phosphatase PAP2 family protein n=1 Tax=Natrialba swarupiae TaxID=2448032 RepID=A0A5D5AT35_9EURY|nr:phosphatase PAP2 family protein [Natrialba swarupiae]TYT62670.1 phosphatase PAP2 family protein [Natrialba swarupiae]